jgi:hypothetical protein
MRRYGTTGVLPTTRGPPGNRGCHSTSLPLRGRAPVPDVLAHQKGRVWCWGLRIRAPVVVPLDADGKPCFRARSEGKPPSGALEFPCLSSGKDRNPSHPRGDVGPRVPRYPNRPGIPPQREEVALPACTNDKSRNLRVLGLSLLPYFW